jgi:hypothetical protein
MTESKPKPSTPAESTPEVRPMKDLELDESQSGSVRGGTCAPGGGNALLPNGAVLPGKVSDATFKTQLLPLKNALARLSAFRF